MRSSVRGSAIREILVFMSEPTLTMTPEFDLATRERSRRVVILGSTGSIGTQALDVVAAARTLRRPGDPDDVAAAPPPLSVTALAAGTSNLSLLAEQAVRERVAAVATSGTSEHARELGDLIAERATAEGISDYRPEILHGPDAATRIAGFADSDVVLNGITGSIGLAPTLTALNAGKPVALANKESLIAGGTLVKDAAAATGLEDPLIPVDSEHSALAQALRGGRTSEVNRLILTASGGPFRGMSRSELASVTPRQALNHPTWDMGVMVTTNSATMVNKALEVLEASLLFDVELDRIDVTVHRQSVVHSMVQFVDGSTLAQASPPDMRLPIALGIGWPHRITGAAASCDWTRAAEWTFEPLDSRTFPAIELMKRAGGLGGTWPAVYNAANEQAVHAFHRGQVGFTDIVDIVAAVLEQHDGEKTPRLEDVLGSERWARVRADQLIAQRFNAR